MRVCGDWNVILFSGIMINGNKDKIVVILIMDD